MQNNAKEASSFFTDGPTFLLQPPQVKVVSTAEYDAPTQKTSFSAEDVSNMLHLILLTCNTVDDYFLTIQDMIDDLETM